LRGVEGLLAPVAALHVAFPISRQGRHTEVVISELYTWPVCTPVKRFARVLANAGARLGAKMVRYSFLVRLSHPLLPTGLSRRFPGSLYPPGKARSAESLGRFVSPLSD